MQTRVGHVLSREDADLIFQPRKTLEVKPVANMIPRGTIVTVFTDGESVSSSDGNFYTKAEGQFEWLGCLEVDHRLLQMGINDHSAKNGHAQLVNNASNQKVLNFAICTAMQFAMTKEAKLNGKTYTRWSELRVELKRVFFSISPH